MSNLSELLPAGAGGKQVDFVASGTLSSGQSVILKTDGTVEAIGNAAPTLGATSASLTANQAASIGATYDSINKKVVLIYVTNTGGQAVVGTISGTTITFGSLVYFNGANSNVGAIRACFDVNAGKVLLTYQDGANSNYGIARVGTVSGTSISFGTAVVFNSGATRATNCSYDSTSQKNVIAFTEEGGSYRSKALVGTISGTGISFGSTVTVDTGANYRGVWPVYDPDQNKTVVTVSSNTSSSTICYVGTVSGTSISFGSGVTLQSNAAYTLSPTYDTTANKIVFCYAKASSCAARVGTVSGTSISFGTETEFNSVISYYISASYMPSTNTTVLAFVDNGNSEIATYIIGTVSGTGISFGSKVTYNTNNNQSIATVSAPDFNAVTITSRIFVSPYPFVANVYSSASNYTDFIGITDAAISDTATGSVTVKGGVSTSVSSLTIGSDYYVQDDGTLATTVSSVPAGRALSATSILLEG